MGTSTPPESVAAHELRTSMGQMVLREIPRSLALLDKNPLSSSFGSFDRKFWHYKIIDFPCGMQQELVLPVAYIWSRGFDGNGFHDNQRLATYIRAAFDFHVSSVHKDGSLDDYFPYERALGATGYALAALTEAARFTNLAEARHIAAFERSGEFIATWPEKGLLSNHYAIAACALANLWRLTNQSKWRAAAQGLVRKLESAQHAEGWFPEYDGCDLGYQTVTLEFLARYAQTTADTTVELMLSRAVHFLRNFLHPDGSFGGEYGSRNTYNFYPGGFALLSRRFPAAAEMLGAFSNAIGTPAEHRLADDGVFGHMLSSYITSIESDMVVSQPKWQSVAVPRLVYLPGCNLFYGESGNLRVFGGAGKGGAFKIFEGRTLRHSDTGFAGRFADGNAFCQNKTGGSAASQDQNGITILGELHRYRSRRLSPVKMITLRLLSTIFGRWPVYSHWIRIAMQRLLVFGGGGTGLRFERRIRMENSRVTVEDRLTNATSRTIAQLYRSTDCVNTHVITSDSFQTANLLPWSPLDPPAAGESRSFVLTFEEVQP